MAIDYVDDPKYFEYLDGQVHPKVSPRRKHGMVQAAFSRVLHRLGRSFGDVASEWRMRLRAGAKRTEFQPDVSFMSFERLRALDKAHRELTPVAPDIAVEIRSPGDDLRYLEKKIERYFAYGSVLVFDVSIDERCVVVHDRSGSFQRFDEATTFSHDAVPWLSCDVAELFEGLDIAP